jgi:hypothetical protein
VSKNVASGLIKITREAFGGTAANADLVGYAVINGLEQGSLFGAQSLSRLAQAATLQGFMEGGDRDIPGDSAGRIVPLPRVEIIDPDPNKIWSGSSIGVKFNVKWSRWDDRKYSPSYPNAWYDSTPLQFNAMYSEDNGRNWKYVNSDTPVLPEMLAKYNPDERIEDFLDAYTMTSPTQNWEFPWDISGFSSGTYLLRVNANRESFDQGLSYHEMFITIKKD